MMSHFEFQIGTKYTHYVKVRPHDTIFVERKKKMDGKPDGKSYRATAP